MDCGDVFLMGTVGGQTKHWWIIISDPKKHGGTFVIVNITTDAKRTDKSCVLKAAEHPWITAESYACYGDAIVVTPEKAKLIQTGFGEFIIKQPPCKADVLHRIIQAAKSSKALPIICKKYL